MPESEPHARILGKLLVLQSVVTSLESRDAIFEFVKTGLLEVPGVTKVEVIVEFSGESKPEHRFPIQVGGVFFGYLALTIQREELFEPYRPFIGNLAVTIALVLEMHRNVALGRDRQQWLEEEVRSRTREALHREQDFRSVLETLPDTFFRTDATGKILFVSPGVGTLLGYGAEEVQGDHLATYYDNPDDWRRDQASVQDTHGALVRLEGFMRRRDGQRIYCSTHARARLDDQGNFTGVDGLTRDISDRILIEEALRKSEKYNRMLFEHSPIGLALCRMDGQLVDVNPAFAAIIGRSVEETLRLSYWDITPQNYQEDEKRQLASLKEWGRYGPYEKNYIHKDGHRVPVLLNGMILERDGVAHIWSSVEDISIRKRMEAQLRQSQKMEAIGTLTGGIAHEFNNILAIILGVADLTRHGIRPWEESLDTILQVGLRGRDIVQQLLTFSRRAPMEKHPIFPAPLIKEVVKFIRPLIPASIEIRLQIREAGFKILAHPALLHQMLVNLCNNAAQAMGEEGGILEVGLERTRKSNHPKPDWLSPSEAFGLIWVRDNGPGMTPDVLDRIFEPFFTTKRVGEGTGLGLSVVHGAVQECGGNILVESAPGQGTTFKIYLPCAPSDVSAPEALEPPAPHDHLGCILFVDDEPQFVDVMRNMLISLGYAVEGFTNPVVALARVVSQPDRFHAVITDQIMPGMSGFVLAREIHAIRPDMPIFLCTGYSERISEENAASFGFSGFFLKPVFRDELDLALRTLRGGGAASSVPS